VALTHTAARVGFELGFGGGWRECVVRCFILLFDVAAVVSFYCSMPRFLSSKLEVEFSGAAAPLDSYLAQVFYFQPSQNRNPYYYLPKSNWKSLGANAPLESLFFSVLYFRRAKTGLKYYYYLPKSK
jgi:hypothetical protein